MLPILGRVTKGHLSQDSIADIRMAFWSTATIEIAGHSIKKITLCLTRRLPPGLPSEK